MRYSFYTLSYDESFESMIENAVDNLAYTSYIKIKYIDNIPALIDLLHLLEKRTANQIYGYIIDANASWKPESFKLFIEMMDLNQNSKIK